MIKTQEQLAAAHQAAADSLLSIVATSLTNAERLAALNLNAVRAFLTDAAANVGALTAVKDTQDLVALQNALVKPAVEKSVAYSRSVYEILSDSANDLAQIAEGQAEEIKKNLSVTIEHSLRYVPAGSEPVVAAVKSALAQADSAYETLAQSSKQARALIENTVASANAATVRLIAKAA